ncbi:DUF4974 domain-containing protein [Mucilaginibacter mali]|uniref:DUF4974 domain-containing protein n=1 Tax=Mucilaginibacter mali TaxID=2740462 RepID=A0A7D4QNL5_9SPHI|nr:FecR domain-containing protein [Mucilaginibacter mali]QKJ32590.1 DUF4974 domain-containing protein [Mucilaginibacter mali]
MEEKQLDLLMRKFLDGTANESEKQQLNDWYRVQNERDIIWETDQPNEEKQVAKQMRQKLEAHIYAGRSRSMRFNNGVIGRAAAIFIGVSVMAGAYFHFKGPKSNLLPDRAVIAATSALENRYVLLPDSSTVLLHPGAKIDYHFDGKTRQLTLIGEAYFDIRHKTDQPFIIHTGKVITTVLGTAFNIKAYPGQKVTVAVTRGKVSVIDETKKMLAILTPNQSVEYSSETKTANQRAVKSEEMITWVKADMQFDDIPFKELAEKLEHRYNVSIKFKSPASEKQLISGHFNGTEPLDRVLQIISETTATTYTIDGNTVTVDTKGN